MMLNDEKWLLFSSAVPKDLTAQEQMAAFVGLYSDFDTSLYFESQLDTGMVGHTVFTQTRIEHLVSILV